MFVVRGSLLRMADATGTQASRLQHRRFGRCQPLSCRITIVDAFGSLGVAGESPAFQSHPPSMTNYELRMTNNEPRTTNKKGRKALTA